LGDAIGSSVRGEAIPLMVAGDGFAGFAMTAGVQEMASLMLAMTAGVWGMALRSLH